MSDIMNSFLGFGGSSSLKNKICVRGWNFVFCNKEENENGLYGYSNFISMTFEITCTEAGCGFNVGAAGLGPIENRYQQGSYGYLMMLCTPNTRQ